MMRLRSNGGSGGAVFSPARVTALLLALFLCVGGVFLCRGFAASAQTDEGELVSNPANCSVNLQSSGSWSEGEEATCFQCGVSIANDTDLDISAWRIVISAPEGSSVTNGWNGEFSQGEEGIVITPLIHTTKVAKHSAGPEVGFIVRVPGECSQLPLEVALLEASFQENFDPYNPGGGDSGGDDPADPDNPDDPNGPNGPDNPDDPDNPTEPLAPAKGPLHVKGTQLVNADGQPVQLRGVSTHGLAWYPEYVNYKAFKTLRDTWGADVIRLAMYTEEYGGYCSGGDKKKLKALVDKGVTYATQLGMYVIIDWHILADGNPTKNQDAAVAFFKEMSKKYADHDNVIYEICNEPQGSPFATVIRPYAKKVISTIREYDKDAVIIVGTNTWSQDVDDVIGHKLDDPNVMYALHFYAGTHKDNLRNKLKKAIKAGVPVFVSECSITDASGNGSIDYSSAKAWMSLLNKYGVSYVAWSLSNKAESSALIKHGVSATSGWSDSQLSDAGRWFKEQISKGRDVTPVIVSYAWKTSGGKRYLYDSASGEKVKGWAEVDGQMYYLDAKTGAMRTGWVTLAGKRYYFQKTETSAHPKGSMRTGWLKYGKKRYYLSADSTATRPKGSMRTGWVTINGYKYYFQTAAKKKHPKGSMRVGKVVIKGKTYRFAKKTTSKRPIGALIR